MEIFTKNGDKTLYCIKVSRISIEIKQHEQVQKDFKTRKNLISEWNKK